MFTTWFHQLRIPILNFAIANLELVKPSLVQLSVWDFEHSCHEHKNFSVQIILKTLWNYFSKIKEIGGKVIWLVSMNFKIRITFLSNFSRRNLFRLASNYFVRYLRPSYHVTSSWKIFVIFTWMLIKAQWVQIRYKLEFCQLIY